MHKYSKIIVKSYKNEIIAPADCDPSENYWLLIGKTGRIINKEINNAIVLVELDEPISNLGLKCNCDKSNSIYINECDLNLIYQINNRTKLQPERQVYDSFTMHNIYILYIMKCFAVLFSTFATCYVVLLVFYCAYSGSVPEISRYGHDSISRNTNPVLFWITIGYHMALGSWLSCMAYCCLAATGLIKKNKLADIIIFKGNFIAPDFNKPLPVYVVVSIIFTFISCIIFIAVKWYP